MKFRVMAICAASALLSGPHDAFPTWAVQQLAAIRKRATVRDWMRTHAADSLTAFAPAQYGAAENWCARASVEERLADTSRGVRRAYFYPPPLTAESQLPVPRSPAALAENCVVGAIYVETSTPTVDDAVRLAAGTGEALAHTVNATPQPLHVAATIPIGGGSQWSVAGPWTSDSTTLLAGAETRWFRHGPRTAAVIYAPVSALAPRLEGSRADAYSQDSAAMAAAARLAGLSATPLLALSARAESVSTGSLHAAPAALQALLFSTLRAWLAQAKRLDASHRAAALLAADRILGRTAPASFGLDEDADGPAFDSVPYHTLAAMGATFGNDHYVGMIYTHSWQNEAVRINPRGPAGSIAFMELLRQRFDTDLTCPASADEIIRRAAAFLSHVTDSSVSAEVHFTLADAYSDSVGMAAAVNLSPQYQTSVHDVPSARAKALEHIRAGLALDRTSPLARLAWAKAWRLLAGLPPIGLRFYCEAD